MSSITDNNINEMLERRQTRSGTPLGGRSSVEKTGSNQKRSSLRQRTRAQTGNEVSTITEVVETQTTEVVFTENSVTADAVDIRSLRGRQKKSASVERTKNAEVAKTAVITTVTNKEPQQLYKATRRLFDQKEELKESDEEEFLADSTTRESQVFDYGSYSSDDGSGKPLRAYDIYKRAGEYWNVFPKTDFTYSPTSEDRREIAPGVINIPNMSRRGIHREGDHGRLRSPTRYRSIRTVTTSSSQWSNNTSTPKNIPASKLKFWSSLDSDEDEVDSELRHRRIYLQRSSRLTQVKNFFTRYITIIWTVITTFYAGAVEKVSHAFGSRSHSAAVHSRHIATVSERNGLYSRLVYFFSKIWDISSRIFVTDVWLATLWNVRGAKEEGESSSAVAGGRNNRRLLWLLLIPFLILAGVFLFQDNLIPLPDIHIAIPGFIYELPSFFHRMFLSLHVIPDFFCSLPGLIYHAALKVFEFVSEIPGLVYRVPEFLFKIWVYLSLIPGAAYWILESLFKILGIFPHTFLLVKEALLSLF